jgi:asparagine synthase (glutamine-hydrolysing)
VCGIAGVIDLDRATSAEGLAATAKALADRIAHRGPDDHDVWVDASAGIAFGHRRLAIVDLSPTGHQPMTSADGRFTICFNGEIYNHRDLRAALEHGGHRFRGTSDTEVFVEALATYGLDATLEMVNGMFAFALWDAAEQTLHLVRDRLGEKPLYYATAGRRVVFASEMKALREIDGIDTTVDRAALASYMRLGYIPAPHTIHRGVQKLAAGTCVRVSARGLTEQRPFWDLRSAADVARDNAASLSEGAAVDQLDELLRDAVSRRLQADVPVGVFLSGGVDSTAVTAIAQSVSREAVKTFTVAFAEHSHDESAAARAIADHLGTDHRVLPVAPRDALAEVDHLATRFDEPFADPSAVPTALISRLARQHVTVALSGDGGDEVFGGYNRTVYGARAWPRFDALPRPVRSALRRAVLAPSHSTYAHMADAVTKVGRGRFVTRNPADKVQRLGALLGARATTDVPAALVSIWGRPCDVVTDSEELPTALNDQGQWLATDDMVEQMLYLDAVTTLPDQMLTKVDRSSMAASLEVRPPLLDHRVVELAWTMPTTFKVRPGSSKWVLRRVLDRYVPATLTAAPKMGFDPPLAAWLRGPLRDWAAQRLAPSELSASGLLRPAVVEQRWTEHLSGQRNWDYQLWAVLMFEEWRRHEHHPVPA